jgi:hypothetical protein
MEHTETRHRLPLADGALAGNIDAGGPRTPAFWLRGARAVTLAGVSVPRFTSAPRALVALLALAACGRSSHAVEVEATTGIAAFAATATATAADTARARAAADAAKAAAAEAAKPRVWKPSRAGCDAAPVFDRGKEAGAVCVDDLAKEGLTLVDLSDTWTPRVFSEDPVTGEASPYRPKYLRLANQHGTDLGLFGIQPSLSIVAERLVDDKRQACQAAVDRAPIEALRVAMEAAAPAEADKMTTRPDARDAVKAAQAELVCDKLLLKSQARGSLAASTQIGLEVFRRRHMIVAPGGLDAGSVAALALPGDELDFRALLRGLRERVADAADLVEDGTAAGETAPVVDRQLDFTKARGALADKLPGGAPDLVDRATDAAARALGWTSPDAARAFLEARGAHGLEKLRVAVKLPAAPAYASKAMDLRIEIDRGDVFYDTPYQAALARKRMPTVHGPTFVLYAKNKDGRDVPLMRWATTIGGWKKERIEEGQVVLKYKESDVGERFLRQLVAAPAWLPPDSTPEAELVKDGDDGEPALRRDVIEPGFWNAYGLVMMIHEERVENGDEVTWEDHGIRTHGSVSYKSILRGESHGCHRLLNHLALRLSGYLLAHRAYVRRGKLHSKYQRKLAWKGKEVELDVPERGYLFQLDPPVPIRVLEGNIAGDEKTPITSLIHLKKDPTESG